MPERFAEFLQRWLITTVAVLAAALIVPGIGYQNAAALFLASLLLGLLNTFVRPLLVFFTLPFVLLTLGLGLWVINALLLLLVGSVVKGFTVAGFGSALLGALIISLLSFTTNVLLGRGPKVSVKRPTGKRVGKTLPDKSDDDGPVIDV